MIKEFINKLLSYIIDDESNDKQISRSNDKQISKLQNELDNTNRSNKEIPKLIYFHAEWCGPCKMQGKVIKNIEKENKKLSIIRINVDDDPKNLINKYGIKATPSIVLSYNGITKKLEGDRSKNEIYDELENLMNNT